MNYSSLFILCFFTIFHVFASDRKGVHPDTASVEIRAGQWPDPLTAGYNFELIKSYNWIKEMQFTNGLVESAENTNLVSLYDNALTALVFLSQGEVSRAERIFEFFNRRMAAEFEETGGGFYQFRDAMGNNGERIWLGDNAWLLIALNHYHSLTGNDRYNKMRTGLATWIRKLQKADGSIRGGHYQGENIPLVTEGMLAAFVAVEGYDKFHRKLLKYLRKNRWDEGNKLFMAWPDNPSYTYALDVHSLSALTFAGMPRNGLKDTSRFYTKKKSQQSGREIYGFCFDEDKDVIWYEGSAQMALAFKRAGMGVQANFVLDQLKTVQLSGDQYAWSAGLPYTSGPGTSYGSRQLWEHAPDRAAISSNAWFYFATLNFNPLDAGVAKEIPRKDQFWLD